MKKYVILSDIHSNFESLSMLSEYNFIDNPEYEIIFLGDYIDGYDLKKNSVINTLNYIKDLVTNHNAKAIIGNHDEFLIGTAENNYIDYVNWKNNGGKSTMKNMGIKNTSFTGATYDLEHYFYNYYHFLSSLPLYIDTKNILFVHAGVKWGLPISEQASNDLLWVRNEYFYDNDLKYHKNDYNKVIVSGHTPTSIITNDVTNPVVKMQHDENDTPRYVIDGGSKSGVDYGINVLILNDDGTYVKDFKLKGY